MSLPRLFVITVACALSAHTRMEGLAGHSVPCWAGPSLTRLELTAFLGGILSACAGFNLVLFYKFSVA